MLEIQLVGVVVLFLLVVVGIFVGVGILAVVMARIIVWALGL